MPYRLAISHYIPLKNHLADSMSANIFTSGNLPESPTTTPHGQWSHLSGKVFYMFLLVGCISCLVEKSVRLDSNQQRIHVLSIDLFMPLCPLSYIPITVI